MYEVETLVQKSINKINVSCAIIIVNKYKKVKILGLTISEWLKREFSNNPVFEIDLKAKDDLRSKVLPYCNNFDYIMIIYNNTPYITKSIVAKVIEYVSIKQSNACKLHSGAVYNSRYYVSNPNCMFDNFYMQGEDAFVSVETPQEIAQAEKNFSKRVINTLQAKGVIFQNPMNTVVSPLCDIGRGTTILNNCVIQGKTIIGKDCLIHNNSSISDSKIGDGSSVSNSNIIKSKIGKNVLVSPYCNVIKSTIGDNSTIGYYCVIDTYRLKKGSLIADRNTLKKEEDK
ncbi:MAG: hypothetical protein E7361_00915 [Clostridiales bacterium]|nr:hypothetical protein [Clostridiales bacterium]